MSRRISSHEVHSATVGAVMELRGDPRGFVPQQHQRPRHRGDVHRLPVAVHNREIRRREMVAQLFLCELLSSLRQHVEQALLQQLGVLVQYITEHASLKRFEASVGLLENPRCRRLKQQIVVGLVDSTRW